MQHFCNSSKVHPIIIVPRYTPANNIYYIRYNVQALIVHTPGQLRLAPTGATHWLLQQMVEPQHWVSALQVAG